MRRNTTALDRVRTWAEMALVALALIALGWTLSWVGKPDWPKDPGDQWEAVAAIASTGTFLGIFIAWFGLTLAADELKANKRMNELYSIPYFRVFVGFSCLAKDSFRPPPEDLVLSMEEVVATSDDVTRTKLKDLHSAEDGAHELCVWLENLQANALGVAFNVEFILKLEWREAGKTEVRDHSFSVNCLYVQPQSCIKIALLSVGSSIEYVGITPVTLVYDDIYRKPLGGGHGPVVFAYNRASERVSHEPLDF